MVSRQDPGKTLDSFCQNRSSLKTKIALLTFYEIRYSFWTEKTIALLEYLQIISQTLFTFSNIPSSSTISQHFIFSWILYLFKLVNPSFLLNYGAHHGLISAILTVLLCYIMLKLCLFAYISLIALKRIKKINWLVSSWQWIFKLQSCLAYYFITSFWMISILTSNDSTFTFFGISSRANNIIAGFMIAIEFLFSVILKTQFCYVLPTKNFLASKNQMIEIITLFQKLIIQICQIAFQNYIYPCIWTISIGNVLFDLVKNYYYYTTLPLYRFKALIFQGDLLNLSLALHIPCLLQSLLWTADYKEADIKFILCLWIITAIMLIKLSREFLKRLLTRLLTGEKMLGASPELLLHKVIISNELDKSERVPGEQAEKYHFTHLLNWNVMTNLRAIFDLEEDPEDFDLQSGDRRKESFQRIYIDYLEKLSLQYPKNSLIKLFQARVCSKNPNLYIKTIKIASEIRQKEWSNNYLTSSFLLYRIEKSIMEDYENSDTNLDLLTYVENKTTLDKVKRLMLQVAEQKEIICKNVLGDSCNIGTIFNFSQNIYQVRTKIQKTIQNLLHLLPDNYVSPLLLFAGYSSLVDYSTKSYEKFIKLYTTRYLKYEKFFEDIALTSDNIYQEENAFFIVSGDRGNPGQILYCTNSVQNMCGGNRLSYIGTNISTLFPPSLRSYYDDFFRQIFETGNKNLTNKIFRTFLSHKSKHVVEVEFFLRVHPYITQSLCLQLLIRAIPSKNQYLLLREDGNIEGGTLDIAHLLGINTPSTFNVRLFSEDLYKANLAVNMVQKEQLGLSMKRSPSKHQNRRFFSDGINHSLLPSPIAPMTILSTSSFMNTQLDYEEAMNLYNLYTTIGNKVEIRFSKLLSNPVRNNIKESHTPRSHAHSTQEILHNKDNTSYYCEISNLPSLSGPINLVLLQEKHDHNNLSAQINFKPAAHTIEIDYKRYLYHHNMKPTTENNLLTTEPAFDINRLKSEEEDLHSENVFDCHEINNNNNPQSLITSPQTTLITTERLHLLTPAAKNLLTTQADIPQLTSQHPASEFKLENVKEMIAKKAPRYLSSKDSYMKSSGRGRYKSFKAAIRSKSYPRSFVTLSIVFYLVIIATFISQIALKIKSDETMQDLIIKKNLLKNVEVFSYKAQQVQINCQAGALQIQGALLLNGAVTGMVDILTNLQERVSAISKARKEMMRDLMFLNRQVQNSLSENSVQMKGSYYASTDTKVVDLTLFQASEVIENGIYFILNLEKPISKAGYEAFNFLGINILDSFLVKCSQVTEHFKLSVAEQRDSFQRIVNLCLLITPFTLLGITLILVLIIWNQYRIEKEYMLTFIKLKPGGVKDIYNRLHTFKKNLENEEMIIGKYYMKNPAELDTQPQNEDYQKNRNQVIVYKEFRKRYYKYMTQAILYLSSLIVIIIWNYISTESSTEEIYNKESQLEFANFLSERASVGYASFCALYIKNNTLSVEGTTAFKKLSASAPELIQIQSEIPNSFQNVDGNYDSRVKKILYGPYACEELTTYPLFNCNYLRGKGLPVSMLASIAAYSTTLSNKVQDYVNADKSSLTKILVAAYLNIETLQPQYVMITQEAQLIANYVDETLTNSIDHASHQRTLNLTIFSICLLVSSLLIWHHVLIKLREVDNDFKKVLQVFPSKIVLSSFLLKTFLKNTSKEPLFL